MKVNIICSDKGWIYEQFIKQFEKYSEHTIVVNSKEQCDASHYLPYYELASKPTIPSSAWFSHQEERHDLKKKFVDVARAVDCAISHSKKYANVLRDTYHLQTVQAVIPGVDTEHFALRSVERPKNNKMVVVYSGRAYTSSARKNPKLIEKIKSLAFVDFRVSGGKLDLKDMPSFYQQGDICVQPSTIEGGSMAIQESLSCGVPIVSMKGVGVTDEFDTGVIKANDDEDFIRQLKLIYSSKQYLDYWRQPNVMKKMRQQVLAQTHKKFVAEHDKIWNMITRESWKTSRS